MRVHVSSPSPAFGRQILAYAEYRVFAALARYAGIRGAQVVLDDEPDGRMRCSVTIDFDSAEPARARVTGLHAAGTIDKAADRVVELLRRRFHDEIIAASN